MCVCGGITSRHTLLKSPRQPSGEGLSRLHFTHVETSLGVQQVAQGHTGGKDGGRRIHTLCRQSSASVLRIREG